MIYFNAINAVFTLALREDQLKLNYVEASILYIQVILESANITFCEAARGRDIEIRHKVKYVR